MANEHERSHSHTIYVERTGKIISLKTGKSTTRTARFLKPCSKPPISSAKLPKTPPLHEVFATTDQHWPESAKVQFKGCRYPQKKWKDWVDKLSVRYATVWEKTGICDAIMSSIYEIRFNRDLVLGLAEYWCAETNTFMFPWGEASVTLDDLFVLGGLPVVGGSVTRPLVGDSCKALEELNIARSLICKSKDRKASFSGWMNHFFGDSAVRTTSTLDHELEHVAFLSLWLCRYVFTSLPDDTIASNVFPIAIHLARGTPIALAPAVLAAIYQDLRVLTEQARKSVDTIVVPGPFQLVQLWAFEHFPLLAPESANALLPGEPRVARWAKLNSKITLPLVRSVLKLPENFEWRPFAVDVKNWRHSSFYEDDEVQYRTLRLDLDKDDELLHFLKCVRPCELIGLGLDCKEKYMPHRVAMQFGFDQDVPGHFDLVNCKTVSLFVPARTFQPGVSSRYFDWWKDSKMDQENELAGKKRQKVEVKVNRDHDKPSPRVDYSFLNREDDSNITAIPSKSLNVSQKPNLQASRKLNGDHENRAPAAATKLPSKNQTVSPGKPLKKPTIRSFNNDGEADDHITLSARLKKQTASTDTKPLLKPHSTSEKNNSTSKKRRFPITEDLDKHIDKMVNKVSKEAKKTPGSSKDDPVEIDCSDDKIKKDKVSSVRRETAQGGKTVKVTKYIHEEYVETVSGTSSMKLVDALEGRLKKIEKMLGVLARAEG